MSAHLNTTRARHRAALALAGLLVAGLSACSSSGEAETTDAGAPQATSTPAETSSSSPAPSSSSPSSSSSSSSSSSEAPAEEFVITIKDFEYTVPDSVPAGATVKVVNEDSQAHTVTKKDTFNVNVGPNATAEFTAPEAMGTDDFTCLFHGNMKGTLVTS